MEEVIKQAPDNILIEDIEIIFKKNKENVLDTLIELWDIDTNKPVENDKETTDDNTFDLSDPLNKWTKIRNICDSHDIEMQSQLQGLRKQ
jgi:hypothetical protein